MRILLVDDDEVVVQHLSKVLVEQRYVVDMATDGLAGWELAEACSYDLILLDLRMPRLNGIEFCKRLRSRGQFTPVLLLTAQDASSHKVLGLDAGADDYLVKPVDVPELLARIRALLRRREGATLLPVLSWGNLQLDLNICAVTCQGKPLRLTPKEYQLLEIFLHNPQRIFSSSALIDRLWSFDEEVPTEDTVRSHLKGLRKKLKAAALRDDPIETVYGIGYRLKEARPESAQTAPAPAQNKKNNKKAQAATPATEAAETVAAGLQQIWQQTRSKLLQRLAVIEAAIAPPARRRSPKQQEEARQEAHKLAGSLGMFGSDHGSDLARSLERLLEIRPLKTEVIKQVKRLLETLHQEIAQLDAQYLPDPAPPPPAASTAEQTPAVAEGAIAPPPSLAAEGRLLLVDDDPEVLQGLQQLLLPWGFEVHLLNQPEQFWKTLRQTVPDLLVLDVEMPDTSGIELCQQLRDDADWSSLPVLFLTARRDAQTIHRVFAAGADDYISKPVIGPELVTRILNRLERWRLLRHLAETDPLTEIANRRKTTQDLSRLLALGKRHQQPVSLALLDLDNFRQINQRYGHPSGDRVLQQFGALLRQCFGTEDVWGRWGGEEFLIGLYGVARSRAADRLQELQQQFRAYGFETPEGHTFQVSFSVGIAEYPGDGEDWQVLYQAADERLRQAKLARGNPVHSEQSHESVDTKDRENVALG